MSWVCSNCSSNNDDSVSACTICGAERPPYTTYPESTEGKVVFSAFDVMKENAKNTFQSIGRGCKAIGKVAKKVGSGLVTLGGKAVDGIKNLKEKMSAAKAERASTEAATTKKKKKKKATLGLNPFETPWPEHSIELDVPALKEKGYNPINQIVGYILSEDPTYITTHQGARNKIRKLDRDDILQAVLKYYLA